MSENTKPNINMNVNITCYHCSPVTGYRKDCLPFRKDEEGKVWFGGDLVSTAYKTTAVKNALCLSFVGNDMQIFVDAAEWEAFAPQTIPQNAA